MTLMEIKTIDYIETLILNVTVSDLSLNSNSQLDFECYIDTLEILIFGWIHGFFLE